MYIYIYIDTVWDYMNLFHLIQNPQKTRNGRTCFVSGVPLIKKRAGRIDGRVSWKSGDPKNKDHMPFVVVT